MANDARNAALTALIACRREGAWSDSALREAAAGLDRREAALASRLCYGVVQNRLLLDYWISSFAKGKLQPVVQEILRLAVYQLRFLDKIPDCAAVNEAVKQARKRANPMAARLVNGVLRSMLRAQELPMPHSMALRYSHPQELVELFAAELGEEKTEALLKCHNCAPATVLQVNTLRADVPTVLESLRRSGGEAQLHPWLPDCVTLRGAGEPEHLAAFREGWVYAQDTAARLAVLAAGLAPGMRVLDCCAAPGGKSFAAAIAMKNTGSITACDIYPHKLPLIARGAERLGISILSTRQQNAAEPVRDWQGRMDAVLADVPCSGLGVIRKKPEIRYKDLGQTEELPLLQRRILDCQASYVRPGGVLLYSTCTILRRENEDVAAAFLREHPEFEPETVHFPAGSGIPDGAMTTLLPCDYDTDGFFICKFRRKP